MKITEIFKEKLHESDWQEEHARLTIQEIKDWCASAGVREARLSKEGKEFIINNSGDVRLWADDLPLDDDNMCYLPHPFGEVEGNFIIIGNGREKLRSLKNGPIQVYGDYRVSNLGLETLEGMAGSVANECDLSHNRLKDWNGIPSQCGKLIIHDNKITSFTGISKNWLMGSELVCDPIEGGALELLKIEGLDAVSFKHNLMGTPVAKAWKIINMHLKGDRDPIDMQSDFIDADLTHWVRK